MSGIEDTCVLRARGLYKQYGREGGLVRAVDGVDLDVAAGRTLAVMGPSGCGKSTLLHLLGGLDRPTAVSCSSRIAASISSLSAPWRNCDATRSALSSRGSSFSRSSPPRRTSNCRPCWPDHRRGRLAAEPVSSLSKSDWGDGPATCLPRFRAGSASASLLRERWSTSRPSSSLTNRPGTLTAPPRWKCSGFSAPCAPRGSPWWSSPTTSGSPRRRIG